MNFIVGLGHKTMFLVLLVLTGAVGMAFGLTTLTLASKLFFVGLVAVISSIIVIIMHGLDIAYRRQIAAFYRTRHALSVHDIYRLCSDRFRNGYVGEDAFCRQWKELAGELHIAPELLRPDDDLCAYPWLNTRLGCYSPVEAYELMAHISGTTLSVKECNRIPTTLLGIIDASLKKMSTVSDSSSDQ